MTKTKNKNQLPKDWKWVKLGEVCKLKNGFAFKSTEYKDEGVAVIRISDIKYGNVKPDKSVRVNAQKAYDDYIVQSGEILVAMSGATTGKFGIYKSSEKAYQNQRVGKFQILNKEKLDDEFLLYQLHALKRQIEKDAYGGAQPNISSGKIEAMEILLPPKPTQLAIVSKIEELFSEIEKGIESLFTAKEQLKTYRQSVLKWAFEGKLSELGDIGFQDDKIKTSEKDGNDEILKSSNLKNPNSDKGELPKGWKWVKLGDVIEKPKYGTSKKCNYETEGLGVLRIPNIVKGVVDSSDLKFAQFDNQEIQTYNLEEGDLLIIRSNGSVDIVGKCALITKKDEGFLYAGYLIRLRPLPKLILPKYLLNILSSIDLRNQIERKAKSTSGVNNINSEELSGLIISLPSIKEQNLIVQAIESRLSVADKMEESITQSLQQAEALKQSILKKAFEGRLVS